MQSAYELTKKLDELLHEIINVAQPRDQQIHRLASEAHTIVHDLAASVSPDPIIQSLINS